MEYWVLDSSESNRYSRENEPSLFQAVPAFVTVGSLTCLDVFFRCIFLAIKTSADDWELLTPQHDSQLLDLLASISLSSASPQKSSSFALFSPLLQASRHCHIVVAASQTLHCEAWKGFWREWKLLLSLNCPGKWGLAFCVFTASLASSVQPKEWINEELKGGARCFLSHA